MTLEESVVKEAKLICAREDLSLSELVESLLAAYNREINGERKTAQERRVERAASRVACE